MMDESEFNSNNDELEWKRLGFLVLGALFFAVVYYSPPWSDAMDPLGKSFVLSKQGKGALAVALLGATWWVFEVVPIGITSLAIGVLQVLFLIRPARSAFTDFMDPSVLFIFIQEAKDRDIDLIVMGTRGRTGLKGLFIGSVAQKVIAVAPCPVLVVPTVS